MIHFPSALKHYGPCGVVANLEPCAYRPCVHGKTVAAKYAIAVVLLITIFNDKDDRYACRDKRLIYITETSLPRSRYKGRQK